MKNIKENIENVSLFLKEYMEKNGFKGYVLGLSGGIDSAVSLGMAVKAVGKENVRCFALPCTSTFEKERSEDFEDAKLVADAFGVELQKINLDKEATKLYSDIIISLDSFTFKNTKLLLDASSKPLVLANIKARLRMTTLRALSEALGYLVLGTTNKTEEYLGYYTKAGDGGSGVDIEPLADFFKYEIRELATELRVPEKIITKSPSAGLFDNQTDEDEIGFKYDDIDGYLLRREEYTNVNLINRYINISNEMKEFLLMLDGKLNVNEDLIDKVENMIINGNHKRFNPPYYNRNIQYI